MENFLKQHSFDAFLPLSAQKLAAEQFHCTFREVEKKALDLGITPLRYKRNQSTINIAAQKKLFDAQVAIIGCGGLGGHIAEILARIGIGRLILFDFDIFEEHNLNRQNFSDIEQIGKQKVLVVKQALEKINPATEIKAYVKKFDPYNDFELIANADVVVDALDDPSVKLKLAEICKNNNKHFVHGAIAGTSGQFITNNTLEKFYRDGKKGIETTVGNPAFSVTFAASVQSTEVVKLILNTGKKLIDQFMMTDLMEYEFLIVPFEK